MYIPSLSSVRRNCKDWSAVKCDAGWVAMHQSGFRTPTLAWDAIKEAGLDRSQCYAIPTVLCERCLTQRDVLVANGWRPYDPAMYERYSYFDGVRQQLKWQEYRDSCIRLGIYAEPQ